MSLEICLLANPRAVHTRRWARAYAERGHRVTVLSVREAEIPGVRVRAVRIGPGSSESLFWLFLSYCRLLLTAAGHLRSIAPDVVHAHFSVTHGVIAAWSGFHPTLLSVWGSDVIRPGGRRLPWLLRRLNRFALTRADLVTATSRFLVDATKRLAPLQAYEVPGTSDAAGSDAGNRVAPVGEGTSDASQVAGTAAGGDAGNRVAPAGEGRIRQVAFGVDTDVFRPADSPRTGTGFRIGFVKTLRAKYGADVLLAALPRILEGEPEARLIVAGRGPRRRELEEQARELGISERVELLGFVEPERVPELLRSFDVLVNPSLQESFGVAILEGSATGLPVVAANVDGVPEVCLDEKTGLLVPPGDAEALAGAILRLASDPALHDRLGRAGRRFVEERYDWAGNVDTMLAALSELAARHDERT